MKTNLAVLATALAVAITPTPVLAAGWTPWYSLGGALIGGPSVITWGPNASNIAVFVRGTDNALWWNTTPVADLNKWSGWQSVGGTISSSPSCVAGPGGRIYCYARAGADNALWTVGYQTQDVGKWGTWKSLGGGIRGAPSATSWSPGHVVVFARGLDNVELYQIEYGPKSGETGVFSSNGGATVTDPACAALAKDDHWGDLMASAGIMRRVACYAMGTATQMFEYASWWYLTGDQGCSVCGDTLDFRPQPDDTTKNWVPVDGATAYQASLIYSDANAQDVYVTGLAPHNTLFHRAWRAQSGWGAWEDTGGGNLVSGPSCFRAGSITMVWTLCAAQTADGRVSIRYTK